MYYIKDIINNKPQTQIYVGTDSQNSRKNTTYATVIVLHYMENDSGKGGHVIYSKESIPKIRDKFSRLWGEVERTIDVANLLKNNNINIKNVDLDYNEDPKFSSNSVLKAAVGYAEASGFNPRWKPMETPSCRIADSICK